jgi:hypothetical protein
MSFQIGQEEEPQQQIVPSQTSMEDEGQSMQITNSKKRQQSSQQLTPYIDLQFKRRRVKSTLQRHFEKRTRRWKWQQSTTTH